MLCVSRSKVWLLCVEDRKSGLHTTLEDPWPHYMINSSFWRCVGTTFGDFCLGSHNVMVTALGLCVKWPLAKESCCILEIHDKLYWGWVTNFNLSTIKDRKLWATRTELKCNEIEQMTKKESSDEWGWKLPFWEEESVKLGNYQDHYIRWFGTFTAFWDSYKYKNMDKTT